MAVRCPRILIAGAHSGAGKTSVSIALIEALSRRGLRVQPFKVGPDYLDPTYLTIAAGRPCYNLDGWMMGKEYVQRLFSEKTRTADIAVIEGVMGLFDGIDPVHSQGSTAEVAMWLNAPVLLVVDAHGMSRSVAALVKGYATLEPDIRIVGVVANRCGSERHGRWLQESLKAFGLPELLAAVPRDSFPELGQRHLGLITAHPGNLPASTLESMAHVLERQASVQRAWALAQTAEDLPETPTEDSEAPVSKSVRLGIARDSAFHFYYPDNLEALEQAGCELVEFSPVHDSVLPSGLDAGYIGGGYPEEHAQALCENRTMIESLRRFAAAGKPIYAECGGLMYLSRGIESLDGKRYHLVGLIPEWTRMLDRLKSLGYADIQLMVDSLFGSRGQQLRGHEFHYSEWTGDPARDPRWTRVYRIRASRTDDYRYEGFQSGRVLAAYVHVHFASRMESVRRFVSICNPANQAEA